MAHTLHDDMMRRALELARAAQALDEVPVGAVVYDESGKIVGEGHNCVVKSGDPTAHAEVVALRAAAKAMNTPRLDGLMMAVSLEPCAMCAQAISHAKIKVLRFGAYDVKSGGVHNGARIYDHTTCHHKPEVYGGLMEEACADVLQSFFREKR